MGKPQQKKVPDSLDVLPEDAGPWSTAQSARVSPRALVHAGGPEQGRVALGLALMLALQSSISTQEAALPAPEGLAFFEQHIRPVLTESCYECHSTEGPRVRGGLLLDSRAGVLSGGDYGPAVVPGDLDASLLWGAINHADISMPPREKLPADVIENFRTWILMGAPDPRDGTAPPPRSTVTEEDIEAGRDWWAFQAPQAVEVPILENDDWSHTDIDRFVLEKLAEQDLEPNDDVNARALLRRLSFDLVGLPPSPEELDEFERAHKRDSEGAVAAAAERLLADEGFGERWGRHWLDVARYAESSGRELNATYPHAWRYRDWVVDSINQDRPYDELILAQLAGDLLPASSDEEWADNLVATGFLAIGSKGLRERSSRQFQADLIDEQIDATSRAFLGLSVSCARCHDHKFEPIQQADYYAVAGIFGSTETYFGTSGAVQSRQSTPLISLPIDDPLETEQIFSVEEMEEMRAELAQLEGERATLRRERRLRRRGPQASSDRPMDEPMQEPDDVRALLRLERQITTLESRLGDVDEEGRQRTYCMGVQERSRPRDARLLIRGELDQAGEAVPRGLIQVLDDPAAPLVIESGSSGRLELAEWVASPDNPLTARVFVNRVWLHLLGRGLVATPDDFGSTGAAPSHPELLDHLALRFIEEGWSLKALIAEIVTSRVYASSSQFRKQAFEVDPENRFLWRANERRLEAEAVRDAMLAVSGILDRERPRGSAIASLRTRTLGGLISRLADLDPYVEYRSVYLPVARDQVPHGLDVFDFAAADQVVGQRESTSTPTQALYLMNSELVLEQSRAFARRLQDEASAGLREQVKRAFQLALGRSPSSAELRDSLEYIRDTAESMCERRMRAPETAALASLCQALFASAEFRYLD